MRKRVQDKTWKEGNKNKKNRKREKGEKERRDSGRNSKLYLPEYNYIYKYKFNASYRFQGQEPGIVLASCFTNCYLTFLMAFST